MTELFDVDLADDTLTRVTQGFEGGPSEHPHISVATGRDIYTDGDGALSPSFSDDGIELAFSSTASNLVYGDGNTPPPQSGGAFDGSDAFVVSRILFPATPTPQYVSSAPGPALAPVWSLGVSALSRANGSVLLYVQAPGAGTLRAGAQSAVVLQSAGAAGRNARHASTARALERGRLATRTVATRASKPSGAGLETLTLALAARYRSLAGERGGLSATVTVTFAAPGRATLRKSIPVTFLRQPRPSRSKARSHKAGRR